MRCPSCGARNPESADWCTQCYTSLRPEPEPELEPEPEPEREPTPESEREPTPEPEPASTPGAGTAEPSAAGAASEIVSGGPSEPVRIVKRGQATFRQTAEGLDWQCGLCEEWNPLEVQHCTTCGRSFNDTVRPPDPGSDQPPALSDNAALIYSALLPGSGHYALGDRAMGLARAVMYVLFVIGGVLLLNEAASTQQSILPALPLLLGALVLWITSVYDAVLLAQGSDRQLLVPRAFFWMVVIVLGMLMLAFAASALSVSGETSAPTVAG